MKTLVIWKRKDNSYYYRFVSCTYRGYSEGDINSWGHIVILVIPGIYIQRIKSTKRIKRIVLSKIIRFLEKIYNK